MPDADALPFDAGDEAALEEALSRPNDRVLAALEQCPGDLLVLGAGGKMGPTLARMARRAFDALGRADRVLAVSRFSDPDAMAALRSSGVETVVADLTDPGALRTLPDAAHVVYMVGQKFGTSDDPLRTWQINAAVPLRCAERYAGVPTVVFSTGNVYSLAAVDGTGSHETDALVPTGEYAASCVARERLYMQVAGERGTPLSIVRLNYAVDLRYGVLVDIARRVLEHLPIDVTTGWVNVIWQGDANRLALQSLAHADTPPFVVNVTGPEQLRVRDVAAALCRQMGKAMAVTGEEAGTALLSDTTRMRDQLGLPEVSAQRLTRWVAEWAMGGGRMLGKATRFEVRDGRF